MHEFKEKFIYIKYIVDKKYGKFYKYYKFNF